MSTQSNSSESVVKKRGKLISGFFSLIMGNGKLRMTSAFLFIAAVWHLGITPFWNIGINTFITLGILMFVAFLAGTFFKKWAFSFSSLLILLQLAGLFYVNFEHIDFIKKGKKCTKTIRYVFKYDIKYDSSTINDTDDCYWSIIKTQII